MQCHAQVLIRDAKTYDCDSQSWGKATGHYHVMAQEDAANCLDERRLLWSRTAACGAVAAVCRSYVYRCGGAAATCAVACAVAIAVVFELGRAWSMELFCW